MEIKVSRAKEILDKLDYAHSLYRSLVENNPRRTDVLELQETMKSIRRRMEEINKAIDEAIIDIEEDVEVTWLLDSLGKEE